MEHRKVGGLSEPVDRTRVQCHQGELGNCARPTAGVCDQDATRIRTAGLPLPTLKDHPVGPHIPMSAPRKPHLCDLQGTLAATTPRGPQAHPPAPITSNMASGWGWSSLSLLPPPLGSPLSCSHKQGGKGSEPREADVGRGG